MKYLNLFHIYRFNVVQLSLTYIALQYITMVKHIRHATRRRYHIITRGGWRSYLYRLRWSLRYYFYFDNDMPTLPGIPKVKTTKER